MRTVFGIHDNESVRFLSLEGAENYLMENYPEHIVNKDQAIEFMENMIWEDKVIICEGCGEETLNSEKDENWSKPRCCDTWYCNTDCHN
jgi:hypothetical protein